MGVSSWAEVAYPSGAPEHTLVSVGFAYSSFSDVCSMFVFRFILLAMVLSIFRSKDFCLPLWYHRISFINHLFFQFILLKVADEYFFKDAFWPHLNCIEDFLLKLPVELQTKSKDMQNIMFNHINANAE